MTPYYTSADGGVVLYCGDARDVLPELAPGSVDLLLTDPPYGINLDTSYRTAKRSTALCRANDYPPMYGDDQPFDPTPLLRFRRVILFGANHYAHRLPPSAHWIVWDKRDGLMSKRGDAFNDSSDAELIWVSFGGAVRTISHRWMGMLKASERNERRVHPTQKPVVVMRRLIASHSHPGDLILDPFAGSGSTLVAAALEGRRAVGVEIEERYAEIAARRLEALPAQAVA